MRQWAPAFERPLRNLPGISLITASTRAAYPKHCLKPLFQKSQTQESRGGPRAHLAHLEIARLGGRWLPEVPQPASEIREHREGPVVGGGRVDEGGVGVDAAEAVVQAQVRAFQLRKGIRQRPREGRAERR